MSFIPDDELKGRISLNLAPMIDFLFLMSMFFATLAVTRITTKDTDIQLVEVKPDTTSTTSGQDTSDYKIINISINAEENTSGLQKLKIMLCPHQKKFSRS